MTEELNEDSKPFAEEGIISEIPETTTDNSVSWNKGFTEDYTIPEDDGGRSIELDKLNRIFNILSKQNITNFKENYIQLYANNLYYFTRTLPVDFDYGKIITILKEDVSVESVLLEIISLLGEEEAETVPTIFWSIDKKTEISSSTVCIRKPIFNSHPENLFNNYINSKDCIFGFYVNYLTPILAIKGIALELQLNNNYYLFTETVEIIHNSALLFNEKNIPTKYTRKIILRANDDTRTIGSLVTPEEISYLKYVAVNNRDIIGYIRDKCFIEDLNEYHDNVNILLYTDERKVTAKNTFVAPLNCPITAEELNNEKYYLRVETEQFVEEYLREINNPIEDEEGNLQDNITESICYKIKYKTTQSIYDKWNHCIFMREFDGNEWTEWEATKYIDEHKIKQISDENYLNKFLTKLKPYSSSNTKQSYDCAANVAIEKNLFPYLAPYAMGIVDNYTSAKNEGIDIVNQNYDPNNNLQGDFSQIQIRRNSEVTSDVKLLFRNKSTKLSDKTFKTDSGWVEVGLQKDVVKFNSSPESSTNILEQVRIAPYDYSIGKFTEKSLKDFLAQDTNSSGKFVYCYGTKEIYNRYGKDGVLLLRQVNFNGYIVDSNLANNKRVFLLKVPKITEEEHLLGLMTKIIRFKTINGIEYGFDRYYYTDGYIYYRPYFKNCYGKIPYFSFDIIYGFMDLNYITI